MNREMILGIVRHAMTVAGGFLVAKGYVEAGMVEQVAGAVVTVVGVVWSILAKKPATPTP